MTTIQSKHSADTLKMIRETLVVAQCTISEVVPANDRKTSHIERLGRLIEDIDKQRPLGPDGKHGNRHTEWCQCEDR